MTHGLSVDRWLIPLTVPVAAAATGIVAGTDPLLGISIGLALGFALLLFVNVPAGLATFTFLTFVAAVPNLGGPAVTVVKIAGFVLLLAWLAALTGREEVRPRVDAVPLGLAFFAVALVGWAAITATWAEDGSEGWLATSRFALNAILFVIVATVVRKLEHAILLAVAFIAGAVVSALYGLLLAPAPDPSRLDRLTGAIDNPNELAGVLVIAVVFSVALLAVVQKTRPLRRGMLWGAGAFSLAALLLTASRGGLIALGFAILASIFLAARGRGRILVVAVAALLASVTYFTSLASPEQRAHVSTLGTGSGRLDIWEVGWRMVEDEPVGGVGAGNFATSSIHYVLEPGAIAEDAFIAGTPGVAHNTYLEVLAELGVIGLILFLGLIAICLRAAWRAAYDFAARDDRRGEILARALLVAIVATLIADLFGSRQYEKELWVLLGLAPALSAIAAARLGAPGTEGAGAR